MKWLWIMVSALVLCTGSTDAAVLRNHIAAIANDAIITRQQIEEYTEKSVDVLRRTYYNQPEVFQKKRAETFDEGLQQLVERELILDDFEKSGLVMPESIVDDEIRDRIREKFGDRLTLTRTLHAEGITFETFRKRIREEIIVRLMIQRSMQGANLVSPAKIELYYHERVDNFKVGEQVKLRMIVLGQASGATTAEIKKLAEEVHRKIASGASFADMAGEISEGSARGEKGDWGWVEKTKLNRGLADIAFSLPTGKTSGVVGFASQGTEAYWIYLYDQSGQISSVRKYTSKDVFIEEKKLDGALGADAALPPPERFYLMLVEDRKEAHTRPLPEVQDQIEKDLLVQEHERLRRKWLDRLKNKAFVRYFPS